MLILGRFAANIGCATRSLRVMEGGEAQRR
jgi:hypothetical protein